MDKDTYYLAVKSVADRYDTSAATIWRWVKKGEFPQPIKITPGSSRWDIKDLEKWERKTRAQSEKGMVGLSHIVNKNRNPGN